MSETEELLSGVAVNMLMSQDGGVVTNHTKQHMCVDVFFLHLFLFLRQADLRFIKFETMMMQFISGFSSLHRNPSYCHVGKN